MRRLLALAAVALAGCGVPVEEPERRAERLPQEVCGKAKEAVEKLTDSGALVLRSPTDGIIPQDIWIPASLKAKEAMANAIALAATCAGEPRLEQEVIIHSETGTLLTRRVVKTSYSTAEALAQ